MSAIKRFCRMTFFSAVAALALGAGLFWGQPARAEDATVVAQMAPVWKLKDLAGNEVRSEQFKGKVVVIDFWATWCVPCIGEIPGYIELQKKYGADGLVIIGVSLDQKGPDHVRKFAESKGMNYVIVMADDTVEESFGGIDAVPTTFLIGRDGRIVHRKRGAMPSAEYEKLVAQALH